MSCFVMVCLLVETVITIVCTNEYMRTLGLQWFCCCQTGTKLRAQEPFVQHEVANVYFNDIGTNIRDTKQDHSNKGKAIEI